MNRGPEDGDVISGGGGRTPDAGPPCYPTYRWPIGVTIGMRGVGGGGPCSVTCTV